MKNEPKTMKAKADLMLKRGSISEAQHKKLHKLADAEMAKSKPPTKPKPPVVEDDDAATDDETGTDTKAADDPAGKFRKRGSDRVTRGEPDDADL